MGDRCSAAAAWLAIALVFGAGACDGPCAQITQTAYVAAPDESLQLLMEGCVTRRDRECSKGEATCPCMPLCLRVLELIDGFKGNETLERCYATTYDRSRDDDEASLSPFTQTALVVTLTYTPSSCDEPAR